jgi:hypothetical protein
VSIFPQQKPGGGRDSLVLPSIGQHSSVPLPPRRVQASVNAGLMLPAGGVILPPRDDAAEYDDPGDTHNFGDDPKYDILLVVDSRFSVIRVTRTQNSPGSFYVLCSMLRYDS